MRRRGCLISLAVFAGLLLLCCVVGYFVGIPRLRDSVSDELSKGISTEVAQQLAPNGADLDPGTYTLSVDDLQAQINANADGSTTSDFGLSIQGDQLLIDFDSGSQSFGYSGTPIVENGRLEMADMSVDNGMLGWVLPADTVADTIEKGVNDYFTSQGLSIESIDLGTNEIEFSVVPAA